MQDLEVVTQNAFEFDFESYQDESLYQWDREKIESFQRDHIKNAFDFHYRNCESYRNYCDFISNKSEKPVTDFSIEEIPLIPTALFKNRKIVSVDLESIVKRCVSSGTQGMVSEIFRDELTMDRLLNSISVGIKEFYGLEHDRSMVVNLGPTTDEAGDVWFSYITSIVELINETKYFVKEGELQKEELVRFVQNFDSEKNLILLGPPVMFKYLIDYMQERGIKLRLKENDLVITAGGWKKFSGEKIERADFEKSLVEHLGIPEKNIYDSFNQVELNTVIFECEHKKKHVPPWLRVIVRDCVTMEPVRNGEQGVLSYLDSSAFSYPCFILSDDLGTASENCTCGRSGQYFEIARRVNRVESKGCAIKIDSKVLSEKK